MKGELFCAWRQERGRGLSGGFSLIELIIAVAFSAILAASGLFILRNQFLGVLDADAEAIKNRLLQAESQAISGMEGMSWGIHFNNVTSTEPFYALFAGSTYISASTTYYLSGLVEFQNPAPGASSAVVFHKLSGFVSSTASTTIRLRNDSTRTKTITVSAQGLISAQ